MTVEKRDVGMAFGNALSNTANLYANNVLAFSSQDWQEELVNEAAVLARAALTAQQDLGNELGAVESTRTKSPSQGSPQRASGGNTSTGGTNKGDDPDRFPYEPSNDPATDGQVRFIKNLLDERGLSYTAYAPLLNKENTKRAIYRMVNKGAQSEEEIFDGIL